MAVEEHLEILRSGKEKWNHWIAKNWKNVESELLKDLGAGRYMPTTRADLSNVDLGHFKDLSGFDFYKVDFSNSNLSNLKLNNCWLRKASFYKALIQRTNFEHSNLDYCNLIYTNAHNASFKNCSLEGVNLSSASLYQTNFTNANLKNASLQWAHIMESNFSRADISFSKVYGVSVWDCNFENARQNDLIINKRDEPLISIDNIEISQFIYLLLNNEKIRTVINTVTSKMVLILGRFSSERLQSLRIIREELRNNNYLPVLFDFEKSVNRDITETISTLAHLSRFVIADITDARSIPQELSHIVPNLPSVPIQPILIDVQGEYGMFEHFKRFPWVLKTLRYVDDNDLKNKIIKQAIDISENKARELNR